MEALKCELCGSKDIIKKDGIYICEHCGTKYTVDEARKLLGTVRIDTSERKENLYEAARRAFDSRNYENAAKYYDMVLIDDPKSWEATFYSVISKVMDDKISQIESATNSIDNSMLNVLKLIKDNVDGIEAQRDAVGQVAKTTIATVSALKGSATSQYNDIKLSIRENYTKEYTDKLKVCVQTLYGTGDYIIGIWSDFFSHSVSLWEKGIDIHKELILYTARYNKKAQKKNMMQYVGKIQKYNASYVAPEVNTSGCYIATAVYGSYDCPEVWTLRRFRDYQLATTWYGRAFIKAYYAISPMAVKWFGSTRWFNWLFKSILDSFVNELNLQGVDDSPYND